MPPAPAKLKPCEVGRFRLSYNFDIMDRTERFYRIDQLLNERRAVSMRTFIEELKVSPATFKRDLQYMRERLNAPIVWDRELRGYRFDPNEPAASSYALPGLWFNASEIHALLSMQQLLADVQPGLLEPHIEPLRSRIRLLLDGDDHSAEEVQRRIRVLSMAARSVAPCFFETVSSALLSRRRLQLVHYSRGRDEETGREVSPQRLVHYRDNWYLDTWCHLRRGLRSFAVDGFRHASLSDKKAREVPARVLDRELGSGYGIFAGAETCRACLRFSPHHKAIKAAVALIEAAERPIILAGNGAVRKRAAVQLRRLAHKTGIGVVNTFMGKGAVPMDDSHCLYTMGLGSGDYNNLAFDDADLVLAVGYDLVEYSPAAWNRTNKATTKIVHIDFNPAEVDRDYPASGGNCVRPGRCVVAAERGAQRKARREVAAFSISRIAPSCRNIMTEDFAAEKDDTGFPVKPQRILWDVREFLGPDDILLSDVGAHKMWISRYFQCLQANTCLISNGFCTMGFRDAGLDWRKVCPTGPQDSVDQRRCRLHDERAGAGDRGAS